jgi:hypothetical protein
MEVKKKPRENISMLLRRFTQRVRQSGILINAKKSMFQQPKLSRGERRKSAVEREKRKKERIKLKKLGKYESTRKYK